MAKGLTFPSIRKDAREVFFLSSYVRVVSVSCSSGQSNLMDGPVNLSACNGPEI